MQRALAVHLRMLRTHLPLASRSSHMQSYVSFTTQDLVYWFLEPHALTELMINDTLSLRIVIFISDHDNRIAKDGGAHPFYVSDNYG